jgi:hypothetical protein
MVEAVALARGLGDHHSSGDRLPQTHLHLWFRPAGRGHRNRWLTRRPATAATPNTCCAASDRTCRRASSTSPSALGSATSSWSAPTASSSSA